MSIILKDGSGKGYSAKIMSDGKLAALAETYTMQAHASLAHAEAFQAFSGERTVSPAGTYGIIAVRNDSEDYMIITYVRMGLNQVETAEAKFETCVGGAWVAGTAVAPVNMHIGHPRAPEVTVHYNSEPTSVTVSDICYLRGPDEMRYNKEGSVVIPPGKIFSIRVTTTTDSVKVYARVSFVRMTAEEIRERE